ncbi:hypothetical protein C4K08_5723 [Pseudomonas chlororaphis subsp. aureofaciens]|nr:hypothetical protein C4K08_5723 [Pseudomonas chlororaphis subsp. aureofaciens]
MINVFQHQSFDGQRINIVGQSNSSLFFIMVSDRNRRSVCRIRVGDF